MEIIDVIKETYYYQKNYFYKNQTNYKIVFVVDRKANKVMIKKAFKVMFGVLPQKVNTQNRHPQPARVMPKSRKNFTKAKKLAFVYLKREDFEKLRQLFELESMPQELQKVTEEVETTSSNIESTKKVEKEDDIKVVENKKEVEEKVEQVADNKK
ncbi:50S ribosomal protein L23 [Mycoplasma parvum]|uniref:50S ribosomal protein L23 n=1 Tax=Mycoplasma parvum str. Indiana TaxID=1403316 RepID=U5NFR5_9MOLU|nr:50S ribosomal protein L23 [Mycoplasma parvum]AGX89088.1 hypothetical protein PRV_01715 [Mycoplasma parvum str. Indiana]